MSVQLDLFQEKSEVDLLREELKEVRSRSENVRRGLFARHNELAKLYCIQKEEFDEFKRMFLDKYPQKAPDIMVKDK